MSKTIALIPARSGSTRIPHKNIKDFFGHPLLAYAIHTAKKSGRFDDIYVSSDSCEYLDIARKYGAKTIKRPDSLADGDMDSWVGHAVDDIDDKIKTFAVLPPTNPFRTTDTIHSAFIEFIPSEGDQVKSMQLCSEHPCKMFKFNDHKPLEDKVVSLMKGRHNSSYQSLGETFIQNGCIYISRANNIKFGDIVKPYFTQGYEGFDINTLEDWILAEELVNRGMVELPKIK